VVYSAYPLPAVVADAEEGDFTAGSAAYRGLAASMTATLGDEHSPLHASCLAMREAAARPLKRAQDAGQALVAGHGRTRAAPDAA
jgi:hypothetical protein